MELSAFLNFAVLTQCFFSIAYLSTYQWRRNKWLVVFMLVIFLLQLGFFVEIDQLSFGYKAIIGNPGTILWLTPTLYLFTRATVSLPISRQYLLLHLLAGGLFHLLFLLGGVNFRPESFFASLHSGQLQLIPLAHLIAFVLSSIFYGAATLRLIRYNQLKYQEEYAESSIFHRLDWLKYTVWAILFLTLVAVGSIAFPQDLGPGLVSFAILEGAFLLAVMILSYFAFRQPSLYQDREAEARSIPSSSEDQVARTLLSPAAMAGLQERLDSYFASEQPYLNPKLRMPEIARALGVSANEFSWYLNEQHQLNFFRFINRYRVQRVVALLQDDTYSHFTLEALGKMAGFQSRTTFINRFKEEMGVTPGVWRKEMRGSG